MECEAIVRRLTSFVDGELDRDDELAVRAHLAGCRRCAERLGTLRAVRLAVRDARPEPDDTALETLHRRLAGELPEPAEATSRRGFWLGLAAGLAVMVGGAVWLAVEVETPADRRETPPPALAAPAPAPAPGELTAGAAVPCSSPDECGPSGRPLWPDRSF